MTSRSRLKKKLATLVIAFLLLGGIFPVAPFLFDFYAGNYSIRGGVFYQDPYPYFLFFSSLFIFWIISLFIIFQFNICNAFIFSMVHLFGHASLFLIFPSISHFILKSKGYGISNIEIFIFIFFSIIVSCLLVVISKKKYMKVIEMNRDAFDFSRGRWYFTASIAHVSGQKSTGEIAYISIMAGLFGAFIVKLPIESFFPLIGPIRDWVFILIFYFIFWYVVLFLGGGGLYITYLVWKRSKQEGVIMKVGELVA